ncbi:MAG: methyltransferase domain-containing protein [Oscillochloris sp.]|nr:methyltransferase domain-containing protein [Oscillochloris sp.]
MYPDALPFLTCPRHPDSPLVLTRGARSAADGAILRGRLCCPTCRSSYPITDGILDMLGPLSFPATPTQWTNALAPTAWGYERIWRPRALTLLSGEALGYERELPLITGLSAPERGGLFVDVACSNGLYARAIARARAGDRGPTVGVDHSFAMLRQARSFAVRERLRISYVRAKAQALPLAAGSATGLAMGGSLNEIGDVGRALAELKRTLGPGGRCVMMGLVRAETGAGQALQMVLGNGGIAFWTLAELNRHYATAGLRLRAQWRYGVVVFSVLT